MNYRVKRGHGYALISYDHCLQNNQCRVSSTLCCVHLVVHPFTHHNRGVQERCRAPLDDPVRSTLGAGRSHARDEGCYTSKPSPDHPARIPVAQRNTQGSGAPFLEGGVYVGELHSKVFRGGLSLLPHSCVGGNC